MLRRIGKEISQDISTAILHLKENGLPSTFSWLQSRDSPVTFQFGKYVVLGGLTSIVHLSLFTWFSHQFFPAHDYLSASGIDDQVQERNAIISNLIAFPIAAVVNYVLNVKFVFTSGRHSRNREILLFLGISFFSFSAGLFSGPFLISSGLNPWFAQAALFITSALVNFACRKFIIFLR